MMKRTLLIVLSILTIQGYSQSTFFSIYNSPVHDEIFSVAETSDNDYILSGCCDVQNGITSGHLIKIDNYGNLLSEIIDQHQDLSYFTKVLHKENTPTELFAICTINSSQNDTIRILSLNTDLQTTKIADYIFTDSLRYIVQEAVNLSDSVLYMSLSRSDQNYTDLAILKFNISDSIFTLFTPEEFDVRIPIDMFLDEANQRIKLSCWGNRLRNEPANKIFNFDLDLNLLTTYVYPTYINSQLRICGMNDTSYLACGSYYRPYDTQRLNTIRLSSNNAVTDSVELNYGYDTITLTSAGRGMLVTNTNIWVVGWYDVIIFQLPFSIRPNWIQLSKLDFDLNIISQHYYGGNGSYVPEDIIETSDNGILIAGYYFNPNAVPLIYQMDPFLLKTNSEGVVVSSDDNDPPITHEAIVLPNPGKDYLQVKLAVQHKSAQLQMFDISGHLVFERDIRTSLERINVSSLIDGTYVYRITASKRLIGSGKWIKLK